MGKKLKYIYRMPSKKVKAGTRSPPGAARSRSPPGAARSRSPPRVFTYSHPTADDSVVDNIPIRFKDKLPKYDNFYLQFAYKDDQYFDHIYGNKMHYNGYLYKKSKRSPLKSTHYLQNATLWFAKPHISYTRSETPRLTFTLQNQDSALPYALRTHSTKSPTNSYIYYEYKNGYFYPARYYNDQEGIKYKLIPA
jgi:hypothetical protein